MGFSIKEIRCWTWDGLSKNKDGGTSLCTLLIQSHNLITPLHFKRHTHKHMNAHTHTQTHAYIQAHTQVHIHTKREERMKRKKGNREREKLPLVFMASFTFWSSVIKPLSQLKETEINFLLFFLNWVYLTSCHCVMCIQDKCLVCFWLFSYVVCVKKLFLFLFWQAGHFSSPLLKFIFLMW